MAKSENLGMQTFDAALFKLYEDGKISLEDALKNADSANNLRLRIKLHSNRGLPTDVYQEDESEATNTGFSLIIEEQDDGDEQFF